MGGWGGLVCLRGLCVCMVHHHHHHHHHIICRSTAPPPAAAASAPAPAALIPAQFITPRTARISSSLTSGSSATSRNLTRVLVRYLGAGGRSMINDALSRLPRPLAPAVLCRRLHRGRQRRGRAGLGAAPRPRPPPRPSSLTRTPCSRPRPRAGPGRRPAHRRGARRARAPPLQAQAEARLAGSLTRRNSVVLGSRVLPAPPRHSPRSSTTSREQCIALWRRRASSPNGCR